MTAEVMGWLLWGSIILNLALALAITIHIEQRRQDRPTLRHPDIAA